MVEPKQVAKIAVVGIGALAVTALFWWLSKEDDLDYKEYTIDKLKALYDEIELELCCIYARNYAHMLSLKDKGEWEPEMMEETKTTIENEILDKVRQVIGGESCEKREPITISQFEKMKDYYAKEATFIDEQKKKFEQLEKEFFVDEHITQLGFADQIPENMTAEKYLLMYKKIWATIRHDMWKEIEEKKKEQRVEKLSKDDVAKIHFDVHENFELVRQEIYSKVMDEPEITSRQARRSMQMCYATHATISSMSTAKDSEAKVSHWPE